LLGKQQILQGNDLPICNIHCSKGPDLVMTANCLLLTYNVHCMGNVSSVIFSVNGFHLFLPLNILYPVYICYVSEEATFLEIQHITSHHITYLFICHFGL